MKLEDFDFDLPDDRIALRPLPDRETAKLLSADERSHQDCRIGDLPSLLRPDDILVFNNTRVIHARLHGLRPLRPEQPESKPVRVEITLHKPALAGRWKAFIRPARRVKTGDRLVIGDKLAATVTEQAVGGEVELDFAEAGPQLFDHLRTVGEMPLPPYIASRRPTDQQDESDYQTIFAKQPGAVAAPTAGLHFTPALMDRISATGAKWVEVTLHVGAGTFLPVKSSELDAHILHSEYAEIGSEAVDAINAAKREKRRVIAVGTTALRVLESAARTAGEVGAFSGETDIFIKPGYRFKAADALITNFHLPKSTLFMLVCAFLGTDRMQVLYRHAIASKYRFYSYGDACFFQRTPD